MQHGYVKSETFAGCELHPGLRAMTNRIGLTAGTSYLFVGYKTSLLRHMIDTGEDKISVSQNADYKPTVQVKIVAVMQEAHEQIADTVRGAALDVVGPFSTAVEKINKVLEYVPYVERANEKLDTLEKHLSLARPGRIAYARDHLMNDRLMVRLEARQGTISGSVWKDTERTEVTMLDIARIVHAD